MERRKRIKLSKLMSYILRHNPWEFGIAPDMEGFFDIEDVLKAIRRVYAWVEREHIKEVVERDEKGRYEIRGNKIRSLYGHTYDVDIDYEEDREVMILYHGSIARNLKRIMEEGIKPMKRKYVHLSIDKRDAFVTGRRHGKDVIVFSIDAECLRKRGYRVYKAGKVRIVEYVPSDCIQKWE